MSSLLASGGRAEVVFVDTRIEGYETIVSAVGPDAEIVLIDASRDGVVQIAEALADRGDVPAIHIVSHGQAGALMFGSAPLHADAPRERWSIRT